MTLTSFVKLISTQNCFILDLYSIILKDNLQNNFFSVFFPQTHFFPQTPHAL